MAFLFSLYNYKLLKFLTLSIKFCLNSGHELHCKNGINFDAFRLSIAPTIGISRILFRTHKNNPIESFLIDFPST